MHLIRKKTTFAICMFLCVSLVSGKTYTLASAIQTALTHHPEIKESEESIKDASAKISEAYGNAWPTLKFSTQYQKAFDQYSAFNGSSSGDPFAATREYLDPNHPDYNKATADAVGALMGDVGNMMSGFSSLSVDYTTAVQFEAQQILYAQGKITTGVRIAKAYDRMTKDQHEQLIRSVRSEVTQSFYQVLYIAEAVKLYKESVTQVTRHRDNINVLYQNGMAPELATLQAELQLQKLSADLEKLRKDLVLAKNALLIKMGLEYDPEAQFEGSLEDPGDHILFPDTSYQMALNKRLELRQLESYGNIQDLAIQIAKADYYPLIVAGGSVGWISGSNGWNDFDFQNDQKVYIALQMDLFNGFQTREKVTQARTEAAKVRIQQNHVRRGIRLQIESESTALQDAIRILGVQNKTIDLAQKTYDMTQASFTAGQSTQLDVFDASLDLRKARLDKLEALKDYHSARVRLLMATGKF